MITGFLTFTIVGPVMRMVSDWITNGIVWLYDTTSFIGMGVFGLCYSAIVLTGLHQSFPAIETQILAAFREGHGAGDFIFAVASMANVAQGAATFAIYFLTKDKKMKSLSSSAGISAMLGITEPSMFGVNLKYRFPFFCALIASGIASAIAGLFNVVVVSLGSAGFLGFLSVKAESIPMYIVCELISFAIAFALTYIYGKSHSSLFAPAVPAVPAQPAEVTAAREEAAAVSGLENAEVCSPVDGTSVDLSTVNDDVFSQKMMGDGAAVVPADGTIYAPVDGEITVAYETKHAYGIKGDNGVEVLIHVGIDTVNLKGEHFTTNVARGQHVSKGDVLGTVDLDAVKGAGCDTTVMVVVTNTQNYKSVVRVDGDTARHGEELIAVEA